MTPSSDWNLTRQLACGLTIIAVLDLKERVCRLQLADFGSGTPFRAKADQNRNRQNADRYHDRRTQADAHTANDAARAVCNQDGIASGAHGSSYTLSVDRALSINGEPHGATASAGQTVSQGRQSPKAESRDAKIRRKRTRGQRMARLYCCA